MIILKARSFALRNGIHRRNAFIFSKLFMKGRCTTMRSTLKKALSVLLAFMLCLSIIPAPALAEGYVAKIGETEYETLAAAVAAVKDGETITLTDNVSGVGINNSKTFTIDLNGHELSGLDIFNAFVTVKDSADTKGKVTNAIWVYASSDSTKTAGSYNSFTLDESATIKADYGIILKEVDSTKGYGSQIIVNGTILSCIWVMGNITEGNSVIDINGKIDSDADVGIAINGFATVNVNAGAKITASKDGKGTAIEVRAGTLNVNGGTITGTGSPTSADFNNNGTTSVGAGIAVSTYDNSDVVVNINGGTIKGYTPLYITNTEGTANHNISLNVTDGTFTATDGGTAAVVVDESEAARAKNFISGGTFSSEPDAAYLAEGAVYSEATGKVVTEAACVAQIGETKYPTLADAAAAAQDGDTVVMLDNSVETAEVIFNVDGSVTLDLGGKTVSANGDVWIPRGSLTVIGASGSKIVNTNDAAVYVGTSNGAVAAEFTLDSTKVTIQGDGWGLVALSNCTVNIKKGKVMANATDSIGISGNGNCTNTTINISGGTIGGSSSSFDEIGIYFPCSGTLTITGGTIYGQTGVYIKSGKLNISGGTIYGKGTVNGYVYNGSGANATGDALVIDNCGYPGGNTSPINITGGKFTSTNAKAVMCYSYKENTVSEKFISGGTFSSEPDAAYLADGFEAAINSLNDSTGEAKEWKVVTAEDAVCKIGDVKYSSLSAAIKAANNSSSAVTPVEITLLKDTTGTSLSFNKGNVVLDLNGHTLTKPSNFLPAYSMATVSGGAKLTVKNSGTTGGLVYNGTGTTGTAFEVKGAGSELTIEESVTLTSAKGGVFVNSGATLNCAGTIIANGYFAITGNGSTGLGDTTINITEPASITSATASAIYHPQSGTLNITGGEITGKTAVYQKSGTLNISGGTLTGNGAANAYTYNGNGANSTGDALVIDNCGYPGGAPTANITGGTFVSENAKAVGSYANGDSREPIEEFISGGKFSSDPGDLVVPDKRAELTGTMYEIEDRVYIASFNDGTETRQFETLSGAVEAALEAGVDTVTLSGTPLAGDLVKLETGKTIKIVYNEDNRQFIAVEPETAGAILYDSDDAANSTWTFTVIATQNYAVDADDYTIDTGKTYIMDSYDGVQTITIPVTITGGTYYGAHFAATYNPTDLTLVGFTAASGITVEPASGATIGTYEAAVFASTPIADGTVIGYLTFTVASNATFDIATETITVSATVNPDYNREITLTAADDNVVIPVAYKVTVTADPTAASDPSFAVDGTTPDNMTTEAGKFVAYVISGKEVTVTAEAKEGYKFVNYTVDGTEKTNPFAVATESFEIIAHFTKLYTVTVVGTDGAQAEYQVAEGKKLSEAEGTAPDAAALEALVDSTKYVLRSWTWDTTEGKTTAEVLAETVTADVTVTAVVAKAYNVVQSTDPATTGNEKAYSDEEYTAQVNDYDNKYVYEVTVTDSEGNNVPATIDGTGKITIAQNDLEGLTAGTTLTINVTKSLKGVVVKAYPYVNNLVLVVAYSETDVALKYFDEALYSDSRITSKIDGTAVTSYVMLIDVRVAGLTGKTMTEIEEAVAPNISASDAAAVALQSKYTDANNVNLTGEADIADIALIYGAYKGTYSYQTNAKGVVKYHDVQYFLCDVAFGPGEGQGELDAEYAQVDMEDVKAEYDAAYGG